MLHPRPVIDDCDRLVTRQHETNKLCKIFDISLVNKTSSYIKTTDSDSLHHPTRQRNLPLTIYLLFYRSRAKVDKLIRENCTPDRQINPTASLSSLVFHTIREHDINGHN